MLNLIPQPTTTETVVRLADGSTLELDLSAPDLGLPTLRLTSRDGWAAGVELTDRDLESLARLLDEARTTAQSRGWRWLASIGRRTWLRRLR